MLGGRGEEGGGVKDSLNPGRMKLSEKKKKIIIKREKRKKRIKAKEKKKKKKGKKIRVNKIN